MAKLTKTDEFPGYLEKLASALDTWACIVGKYTTIKSQNVP